MPALERLSARLRLPEWVVALGAILLLDVALAAGIVGAVSGGAVSPLRSSAAPSDRVWTLDQLRDEFTGASIADVERRFGPHDRELFNGVTGTTERLLFTRINLGNTGLKGVWFHFNRGGRCTLINPTD